MDPDDGPLDLTRLAELRGVLGEELATLVHILISDLERALDAIDRALADGDLPAAARATHAARNGALMVDDRSLLQTLAQLETAARAGEREPALCARRALARRWPNLRRELERAGAAGGLGGPETPLPDDGGTRARPIGDDES